MPNTALITPQILVWARKRLDLSLKEAANHLKLDLEKLKSWEEGEACPTMLQAKKTAQKYKMQKYKIPYVFFFLPEPPENINLPKSHDYRTFENRPVGEFSIELKTLLFDIMQRREVVIQLHHELSSDTPAFNRPVLEL